MTGSLDQMQANDMEDVFLQDGLCPTIAEHATQCNALFNKYITLPEIVPDPTIMDDQLARFTLWASNMDVYGPLNVSLDYRLRFSPTVVEIIHQLLDVICDTLTSLKPIDDPPQTPSRKRQRVSKYGDSEVKRRADDDASDSDSNMDPAEDNIFKITDAIGGTVTRLFRLSNAVRKSAKANRARKIEGYRDDEEANNAIAELRLYTECYIRYRYPMAPDSLCSALVEANALRLRRLYYQRSHRRRIELSVQKPQATPTLFQLPKIKENTPLVRFAPSALPKPATIDKTPGPTGPPPVPVTNATTARQTAVGALYAKSTTEVPRAKSVLVNNKLSFPPLPPTHECPYCGVIIEFKTTARSMLWHNHVIGDLEPFICVFSHCLEAGRHETGQTSPLTFETSKAWISHMQNAHGHTWECRAPSHNPIIFNQESEYQEHSIKEHGVPEMHAGTLSSAARRPVLEKVLECPFGDDFQPPDKVDASAVFASEALQLHVAAHIKEIALLTLQKLPSDVDETTMNVDSDQPLEDEGPGFAMLRGSMYSVLDDEDLDFQDDVEAPNDIADHDVEYISPSVTRLGLEDKDDLGMTQLHHAAKDGDLDLTDSLIRGGTTLGSRDNNGRTALHYASTGQSQHSKKMLGLLLNAAFESFINLGDENGQTALHYAVEAGWVDGIDMLASHSADVRITDNHGIPPLIWAILARESGSIERLISIGADINSTCALAWAASMGDSAVAHLLVEHGAVVRFGSQESPMMPLTEAAASGQYELVRFFLDEAADPNCTDRDGWSAIHWAAEEGHLETVRLLLDAGADFDAISSYGTSPLHCAANGGHISISTCHGWTALHHAAFMGHSHVVQCLLEDSRVRSIASQQDNHGWSVLHLAVHSRDLATVDVLLSNYAIAEPQALIDESGLTAEEWLDLRSSSHSYKATCNLAFSKSRCCRATTSLRHAVITGNVPWIKLLLKHDQDVNEVNSGRRTALYHAAKKRMLSSMDLLLDAGADPNILPTGRKNWEEFISDKDVLLRLEKAGYTKQGIDPGVEGQIKFALVNQRRSYAQSQPVAYVPDESNHRGEVVLTGPEQVIPTRPALVKSTSSTSIRQVLPASQKNDHKRKAGSARSGAKSFWKRLIG
ncbi:ankyrin [Astrocystis sublimbata]|nr:ankyrin [Astrocystis sublimbata]